MIFSCPYPGSIYLKTISMNLAKTFTNDISIADTHQFFNKSELYYYFPPNIHDNFNRAVRDFECYITHH